MNSTRSLHLMILNLLSICSFGKEGEQHALIGGLAVFLSLTFVKNYFATLFDLLNLSYTSMGVEGVFYLFGIFDVGITI